MPPIIGITSTLKEDTEEVATRPLGTYVRADLDYLDGVKRAGGVPLVLPPVFEEGEEISAMVGGLDGLLLSGGCDIHPSSYGEEPVDELGETLVGRDLFELSILGAALKRGIPVFGVCRGLQLINVALGGTLYQDVGSQMEGVSNHRQTAPKHETSHAVDLDRDSTVAGIMGTRELEVNSYHHQSIKRLSGELVKVGRATDGVVEAAEHRNFPERWVLGVQWHAEAMGSREHLNLFEAHVEAARRYSAGRVAA